MWTSYVINLADNTARMDNSAGQFNRLGLHYQRIEGVNGRALSDGEVAACYSANQNARKAKYPLVRSEIGCYLSHILAWRQIADGPEDGGFVFEDDFRAADDLPVVLTALTNGPQDWDMVKLFSFDPQPKTVGERSLGAGHRLVVPYRVPTCLIGYGLSRAAARHLADRAIPFFRPVDEDQKFFWETGLKVALVLPTPVTVGDQQTVTGTIGTERRSAARRGFRQTLRGLAYQVRYRAALYWHRRRAAP